MRGRSEIASFLRRRYLHATLASGCPPSSHRIRSNALLAARFFFSAPQQITTIHFTRALRTISRMPQSHFTLSNGAKIPAVGLGTWQSPKGQVRDAVAHAIKSGYRHIDAAWAYQNEDEVGAGIKLGGVPREELWVTSKLFEFHHEPQDVALAVKETLKNLGLEYLDLYLMHWPVALVPERSTQPEGRPPQEAKLDKDGRKIVNRELSDNVLPTWREMEKLVEQGLVKNIGVSNFNVYRIKKLLKDAKIKPVTNQVELSLACPQPELVAWLKKNDILPQAYSPLGSTGASQRENEVVDRIAKKHGVDGANVLLSWSVKRGCNPLPKSVTPERIENNLKLVDLSEEEFNEIEQTSQSHPPKRVCDQSEDFQYDIYEENHPEHNDKVQTQE